MGDAEADLLPLLERGRALNAEAEAGLAELRLRIFGADEAEEAAGG